MLLYLDLIAARVLSIEKRMKQIMHFITTSCTNIKRAKVAYFNFFHASMSVTVTLLLATDYEVDAGYL